jgi:hypothetical protein
MSAQDNHDDTGTAAKRPTYHYYLDIRNDGKGVGPHTPASINGWLEDRMISPEILARRADQTDWTKLSEIKRFFKLSLQDLKVAATTATLVWKSSLGGRTCDWETAQETRLFWSSIYSDEFNQGRGFEAYRFLYPYRSRTGRAVSRPTGRRRKTKQAAPAHQAIARFGARGLSRYKGPHQCGSHWVHWWNKDRLEELQSEKDDEEIELMFINNEFNDEDVREILGYKKLTNKQLKQLGQYLDTNDPGWKSKSRYDTAKVVLKLFPDQKKAEKRPAHASHKRSHAQSSKVF